MLKDFEVRLDIAAKDFIESDQWPPRRSRRTDPSYKASPPNSSFTPLPNKIETQFSTEQEQNIITSHLEIRLILLAVTVIVEWQNDTHDSSYLELPPPWTEWKWCSGNTNDHHPPSVTDRCQRTKNSVNPGWVEPDPNYNLILVII